MKFGGRKTGRGDQLAILREQVCVPAGGVGNASQLLSTLSGVRLGCVTRAAVGWYACWFVPMIAPGQLPLTVAGQNP